MTALDDIQADPPPVTAGPVLSLSPSRAMDFKACALLYRFRVIDRLPEPPSLEAARGTVVHTVLERLFDLPAAQRTPEAGLSMLEPQWQALLEADPELAELFSLDDHDLAEWVATSAQLLEGYFTLEDPRRLEPAERETCVEAVLPSGLALKGYIDRLDRSAEGHLRVVDYKTGKSPDEAYEGKALFQLKFYALVLWRTTGVIPRVLQLVYLKDRQILRYVPDEADLRATERQVEAIWAAIQRAVDTGVWRHQPSRLCDWCSFQALCPAFGGTPPPLPRPRESDA
jgi:putative RecB family exonuclease